MVFVPEGQFQQFPHCKFRDNVVRLLYIPSIHSIRQNNSSVDSDTASCSSANSKEIKAEDNKNPSHFFLSINKFGKVGLYHPERFSLIHTYCLDLSVPMHPHPPKSSPPSLKVYHPPPPKCERTHLVIDAAFAPDALCLIFATTKNLLQWYDIGEIQQQNIGLELFPRREFMGLCETSFPLLRIPNQGHVESHRLFGLPFMPTCMEYFPGSESSKGKLFMGDVDGGIAILTVPNPKYPLGRRKIRGKLHKILMSHMVASGLVQYYKGHHQPVTDIYYLAERDLVMSCSKDKKFSVFVKDLKETVDSIIVSVTKGVNTITYSSSLKMVATGSDDHIVRLFSQFIMKMPQMELLGHRSAVLTVQFAEVDVGVAEDATSNMESEENPTLLFSYSADSEVRAWDPLTFICLQSLYLNFPIGSTIACKTPEFARKSLIVHQPYREDNSSPAHSKSPDDENIKTKIGKRFSSNGKVKGSKRKRKVDSGTIILLYCNSYARVPLEKGGPSRWPFDYDQFIQEFEELSVQYDKKLKEKLKGPTVSAKTKYDHYSKDNLASSSKTMTIPEEEIEDNMDNHPGKIEKEKHLVKKLSSEEMTEIESRLDAYVKEILELRQTIKGSASGDIGSHSHKRGSLRRGSDHDPESRSNTGRLSSTIEDETSLATPSGEKFNISVHATNKFYEFKRAKEKNLPKQLERMISYGQAFNHYPLAELEPIEFSRRNLIISEEMKKILGIRAVNSVKDLFTPQAQSYFGIDMSKSGPSSRFFPGSKQSKGQEKSSKKPVDFSANTFAVIGRKMRNAYEDDEELSGEGQAEPDQDDHCVGPFIDSFSDGKHGRFSGTNSTVVEHVEELDDYDYN